MKQMTVLRLFNALQKEIAKGNGDKLVVISDDVEGNGYHGLWFGVTSNVAEIAECLDVSNGVSDSETDEPERIVILG